MKTLLSVSVVLLVITGCGLSSKNIESEIRGTDDASVLANAFGCGPAVGTMFYSGGQNAFLDEVKRRGLLTGGEISSVSCGYARIGMSKNQALAAFGKPRKVSRSGSSSGIREQWIYKNVSKHSSNYNPFFGAIVDSDFTGYLYFEGDKLTGWQD